MQSHIRATYTPGNQDSIANDFPTFLGKKTQNQRSAKTNPQSKPLNNHKSHQNPNDHGDSYQNNPVYSDMPIESMGARNINPNLTADGCFSSEDLIRRHVKGKDQNHGRPNQVEEIHRDLEHDLDDVDKETARRRLGEFSLKDLPMTNAGKFDKRRTDVKDYLNLCISADVDPYEYYEENLNKKPEPTFQAPQKNHIGRNQTSLVALKDFPLSSLKWTQQGALDMRMNSCKDFTALCEDAGVDPLEYLLAGVNDEEEPESIREQPRDNYEKSQKISRPVYVAPQEEQREDSDQEAARRKLRDFPLNELWLTKKNILDMRKNNTKEFLLLCDSAGVDAMDYYFENIGNPSNAGSVVMGRSTGESEVRSVASKTSTNSMNSSEKSVNSVESNLTLTKDSRLDKRYKSNKEFIKEKIAEAELRLSQFDTSQLKRKNNGELDKRFKVNKEYMEIQEQTLESYWENMKFNE